MTVADFVNCPYCGEEELEVWRGRHAVDKTTWRFLGPFMEIQPCSPENPGTKKPHLISPGLDFRGVVTPHSTPHSPRLQRTLIVESSSYRSNTYIMAAPEVHHLFHHPIADHSFSADKQTLAVARDTSVELYGRTGSGFKLKDELKGHDKLVTSVDIALSTGRIVTCSQGP